MTKQVQKITIIVVNNRMEVTAYAKTSKDYTEVNKMLSEVLAKFDIDEEYGPEWDVWRKHY